MELEKLKGYSRFLNVDIKEAFHTLSITEEDAEHIFLGSTWLSLLGSSTYCLCEFSRHVRIKS